MDDTDLFKTPEGIEDAFQFDEPHEDVYGEGLHYGEIFKDAQSEPVPKASPVQAATNLTLEKLQGNKEMNF